MLFLEVHVRDASEFTDVLHVRGVEVGGHKVLRAEATAVPNGIAALLLYLRDATGKRTGVYFNWGEGNPALHVLKYVLTGHGDVPPLTREILRRAGPDPARRPCTSGCHGRPRPDGRRRPEWDLLSAVRRPRLHAARLYLGKDLDPFGGAVLADGVYVG